MASTENITATPSLLTKDEYDSLSDDLKRLYESLYGKGVKTRFYEKGFVAAKRNATSSGTQANVKASIGS